MALPQSIFYKKTPDLFDLIRLGLWVFGLQIDDLGNTIPGENVMITSHPDVDFFIRMHITKEATTSSRIEGAQTNIDEALVDEYDIDPEKRLDWQEVQNYIKAINYAIGQLPTLLLSSRLLKETHAVLLQGIRGMYKQPGEFRTSQNWIGINLKHATFIPPHHDQVPDLMSDLEQFMHNDHIHVPHLIKIAIIHILREITGQKRNRLFIFDDYVQLFR